MAGSKRSLRSASAAARKPPASKSSSSNSASKKKKASTTGSRGRRRDTNVNEATTKSSTTANNNNSPPKDSADGDETSLDKSSLNANKSTNNNTAPPPNKKTQDPKYQSSSTPPPPQQQQQQPPLSKSEVAPAKIKGRFMEVKMRQLTSYFSSSKSSSSAVGDEKTPAVDISKGETTVDIEDGCDDVTNSKEKKRPLQLDQEGCNNLKKRRVDDNNDGGIQADSSPRVTTKSDAEIVDMSRDIDSLIEDDNEVGGESTTLIPSSDAASTTAAAAAAVAACPLHLLASAITSTLGDKSTKEEATPKPTSVMPLDGDDKECADKDDNGSDINNPATIGEGGDDAIAQCPGTKRTMEGGDVVDLLSSTVEGKVESSPPTTPNNTDQSPCETMPQKIEEGESSTTPANLEDVEMKTTSQSAEVETAEVTLKEVDANDVAINEDVTTDTITVTERAAQHVAASTDAIMTDEQCQTSVGEPDSPPHPKPSNNFESTTTTTATTTTENSLTVSQLKMTLFLEASRIHADNTPERIFANYWDSLVEFITASSSHSTARSDPSFKLNTNLESFLKTRRMKRLHNKLILALIKDSVKDRVCVNGEGGDCIPRAWRDRTQCLHCEIMDDSVEVVANNDVGSSSSGDSIYDMWTSSFGKDADTWSACGNKLTIAPTVICQDQFVPRKLKEKEEIDNDDEIIPSCRLPGALGTDLFVKKVANDAGLTVSHDSMWLLIVAAREYASNVIGKAIENDKNRMAGQTSRILKSEFTSLACEHLLVEKKGVKKKDTKKKESTGRIETSKGTPLNDSDRKRKVLTSADISQVLHEQHAAAPRLAWMRSMGRGVAQHQPDLEITNDMINSSIQRAAIKRRRIADRKNAEKVVAVNVAPVAIVGETLLDESSLVNESLDLKAKQATQPKAVPVVGNGPSVINDSATKAPPKSSDLLKSTMPTSEPSEPTTESSSVAPTTQSEPRPNAESTATNPPASESVSQIRQISRFGAKNLAAMKARRRSDSFKGSESGTGTTGKKETEEKPASDQSQTAELVTQSQSQQTTPAPAPMSATNQSKEETDEKLAYYQPAVGPDAKSPKHQPASAPTPTPAAVSKQDEAPSLPATASFPSQQPASSSTPAAVTKQQEAPSLPATAPSPLQQPASSSTPAAVTKQQEAPFLSATAPSPTQQPASSPIPAAATKQQQDPSLPETSNITQPSQGGELTMQSKVDDEEEALPQPKLVNTNHI